MSRTAGWGWSGIRNGNILTLVEATCYAGHMADRAADGPRKGFNPPIDC